MTRAQGERAAASRLPSGVPGAINLWSHFATPPIRAMADPPSVFISYSHKDAKWKDKLVVQLSVLAAEGRLEIWDDRRIAAGDDWFPEIEQAMNAAKVAVLLVSADFLVSKFIRSVEVPRLLQRRQDEGLRIVPILVRPCPWKKVEWLAKIQMRPRDGREIARGNAYKIDKDLAAIAEEIDDLIRAAAPPSPPARVISATIYLSALPATGPHFFGREAELERLDQAWATASTNVLSLVAWGGAGKSALVNHWLGSMALENYRGAERVYGWSFYSQGTRETETSADEFIKAALAWFGDPEPEAGSPWQKGERLAVLIRRQRTLLVLDGLEPLQDPPGVEGGKVKDPALGELLRHLAAHNPGLCLVTTRLEVADLADWRQSTTPVIDLGRLSTPAGTALLEAIGVDGDPAELAEAVDGVGGHALTLNLLGTYVRDILDRDARRWREAGLADPAAPGSAQAQKVMAAYEKWFAGRPELAILRILGLFDRPAGRELVDLLRRPPLIAGLNDELVNLPENEWRWALARLRQARLIEDQEGAVIDAHPLVREHFGARLRAERPAAWRAGHGRLYEHLRDSAKPLPDTLAEMAPLFQAMHHGCQAGRHQEVCDEVYGPRIRRWNEHFQTTLGAYSVDLTALADLFDPPFEKPVTTLHEDVQAFILNAAALRLRALGRLREALPPMSASLAACVEMQDWREAAIRANNLSELHLLLGNVTEALATGETSVHFADQSEDIFHRMDKRTAWADALYQAGEPARALELFEEAEALQADRQPGRPLLYSIPGYRYCGLLLAQGRTEEVGTRSTQSLEWARAAPLARILDEALAHLSLGRALLALGEWGEARERLDEAVDGLRKAGRIDYQARGLLARAALLRETRDFPAARRDLEEATRIARRSEMRLFQCDAHLEFARLALAAGDKDKVREHLAEARRLVEETGYGRRRPEVAELAAAVS
jgi:tetratricopeptide (TPR) repeat protein